LHYPTSSFLSTGCFQENSQALLNHKPSFIRVKTVTKKTTTEKCFDWG